MVRLRGRVERCEPDGVRAEAGDGLEVRGDARQIPDPVAVRVREGADVDLVDDRSPPPPRVVLAGGGVPGGLGAHAGSIVRKGLHMVRLTRVPPMRKPQATTHKGTFPS